MRSLWPQLAAWLDAGEPFALATVTAVSGSAPRAPGACMAIMPESSRFIGSVSSGCLDVEVVEAARAALATGATQHLRFGPDGQPPWTDGLSCGGWIAVRVEPWWAFHPRAEVRALAAVVRGWLEHDEPGLVVSSDTHHVALDAGGRLHGDVAAFSDALLEVARAHLRDEKAPALLPADSVADFAGSGSGRHHATEAAGRTAPEIAGASVFLRPLLRRPRMLIVGGVDVAVHLVALARGLGYVTIVADPRMAFVAKERFPVAPDRLERAWPQDAVARAELGPRDVALTLTHDPKIDDPALRALLQSRAGYIGALGSRRSHAARLERLRAEGADPEALARIHGPAGIHLGTPDAAGIALGILAGVAQWRACSASDGGVPAPAGPARV